MANLEEKSKKRLFSFITICLMVTVIFLGGEVSIRLLRPFYSPDTVREASLKYVPSIFSRTTLMPNQGLVTRSGRGGQVKYTINENGYRGSSFPRKKPDGERRIVIIGGSSTFDRNATDEKGKEPTDWPSLVERNLKKSGIENVRVINAGIPGHASFDSLGRLYSQIWMFEPDFVLLYNGWNDIKYFYRISLNAPLISLFHPYDKSLKNPFITYQGTLDRLFSYSQLYTRVFRDRYFRWKLQVGPEGLIEEGDIRETYGPYGPRQFKINVELFVDACHNIGSTPILLTQATLVSRDNSQEERDRLQHAYKYSKLTHDGLVRAFEEIYEIIQSVGKRKDAPILDLASQLNGRGDLFEDEVHTTQKGSEEFARVVAEFLGEMLNEQAK